MYSKKFTIHDPQLPSLFSLLSSPLSSPLTLLFYTPPSSLCFPYLSPHALSLCFPVSPHSPTLVPSVSQGMRGIWVKKGEWVSVLPLTPPITPIFNAHYAHFFRFISHPFSPFSCWLFSSFLSLFPPFTCSFPSFHPLCISLPYVPNPLFILTFHLYLSPDQFLPLSLLHLPPPSFPPSIPSLPFLPISFLSSLFPSFLPTQIFRRRCSKVAIQEGFDQFSQYFFPCMGKKGEKRGNKNAWKILTSSKAERGFKKYEGKGWWWERGSSSSSSSSSS